jgi:hypothetical protein
MHEAARFERWSVGAVNATYHHQALEFIRQNKGSQLSTATLEMYSSYFLYVFGGSQWLSLLLIRLCCRWDYVSWATKAAILRELVKRIFSSEGDARMVVDSPVSRRIWEILASPDPVAQNSARELLGLLTQYEFAIPFIVETRGCEQLVALLL